MADVAEVLLLRDPGGDPDGIDTGPTSLVKTHSGNAHTSCPDSPYFRELCGHRHWKWRRRPCGKWSCQPCRDRRVKTELVPEISRALSYSWLEGREALKFLTLTVPPDATAGNATPEGATAMRLKLQHYVQAQRRKGRVFEYLRVAETHRSGQIHLHLIVYCPYIPQEEIERDWGAIAFISAVGLRCPRCYPGRAASAKDKRRSTIVPPPGRGDCPTCGYTVDWSIEAGNIQAVAEIAALEMSKYLTKESGMEGIRKKMNRSRGWAKLFQVKPDRMPTHCDECSEQHGFIFVGPSERLHKDYPGLVAASAAQVAYYPRGGAPCKCWDRGAAPRWVASTAPTASTGLIDLAIPDIDYGLLSSLCSPPQ